MLESIILVLKVSIAIKTENLTKFYSQNTVVDHLNLEVPQGKIVSLLGPNGAGKSTTFQILTTLLTPDAGTAYINGFNVLKDKSEIRKNISMVPQELVFYEELNACENLVFFGTMQGLIQDKAKERAKILLKRFNLLNRTDKTRNLSGGMKRRLNLAIGLMTNPEVIFLDEPTAGLDSQSKREVWTLLSNLKGKGITILLSTHDMNEADILSDYIFIMEKGKIIAQGSPEELKKQYSNNNILEIIFCKTQPLKVIEEKLKELKFVKEIIIKDDNQINIYFDGGIINLIKILDQEIINDIAEVELMNLRQTTLEDLFLKLTGRRLHE